MGVPVGPAGSVNNEPNLVPMIDVLLVLLVIFMLMVPMNRRVIEMQLPDRSTQSDNTGEQIVLEVIPGDVYRINSVPVPKTGLAARLHQIYRLRPNKELFVKGDGTLSLQEVITAMDVARGSGVVVIGLPPRDLKGG